MGGLPPARLYLILGEPGAGKTTLAVQFLLEGAAKGEQCLYVTTSESRDEFDAVAAAHGWDVDSIHRCELIISADALKPEAQYTIFQPSEVELGESIATILAEVERTNPSRVVIDSLTDFRLLAQNPSAYRRQTVALKQFFMGRACTVLLLDDSGGQVREQELDTLVHGVITLEQITPQYGVSRRRLIVSKLRGREYRSGYHDFRIVRGGLSVFSRLVAQDYPVVAPAEQLKSGIRGLDDLLGGGLDRGASTLLMGPAGSGKSTIAMEYVAAAAKRGETAFIFTFDESEETLLGRMDGLDIPIRSAVAAGLVRIRRLHPGEISIGEFCAIVSSEVERIDPPGASVVVIDSLNGYLEGMQDEPTVGAHLGELLSYLSRRGVASIMIVAEHGVLGTNMETTIHTSYLADTVVILRYFESGGRVRQAASVIKRRRGPHERSLRELTMHPGGIEVGEPLQQFRGILTGVPDVNEGGRPSR